MIMDRLFAIPIAGTPTEAIFDGTRVAYEVTYDASDRIERVVVLKK